MRPQNSLDLLLADSDPLLRHRLATVFAAPSFECRVSVHGSARGAISAFTRARFDAIIVGLTLDDLDAWRFLRMVRSGRFGFAEVPAFILAPVDEHDALLPLLDPQTQLLSAHDTEDIPAAVHDRLAGAPRGKVLIVEDEALAASAAQRALAKYFDTDLATDGEAALSFFGRTNYDLVLLDLMLPRMPGRDILKSMLACKPEQVVIVLTAHGDTDRHQELVLAGASEFLTKPIDVHYLAEACARVLRESRQVNTLARRADQGRQLEEIAARVHAANYSLNRGQTAHATRHLNHALRACRFHSPSDDQWTALLTDFT
jgi:DNA-binding response OmpR family regulator